VNGERQKKIYHEKRKEGKHEIGRLKTFIGRGLTGLSGCKSFVQATEVA
jgi:hypothetical protein